MQYKIEFSLPTISDFFVYLLALLSIIYATLFLISKVLILKIKVIDNFCEVEVAILKI